MTRIRRLAGSITAAVSPWGQCWMLFATINLLLATLMISCVGDGPKARDRTTAPPPVALDSIREPLSRIPVRQDVIKEAAPENHTITSQADATKADAKEATAAVDKIRKQQEDRIRELQDENTELQATLDKSYSEQDRKYRRAMNWLRFFSTLGVGGGIALCFLVDRRMIFVTFACVAMLGAIAVDGFIWRYAMPIAGGALALLVLTGIWYLWRYLKNNHELVETGRVLIGTAGGMTPDLKRKLDAIQSGATKRLVNRLSPKKTS